MKLGLKSLLFTAIITIFTSCKPLDSLNQNSFTLKVVPLNTVGDERLEKVVGVVCDGTSSVELQLDHNSTITPSSVFIDADAKFGTFQTGNSNYDCTAIKYTAPEIFPGKAGESVVNFPIIIRVGAGGNTVFYDTELKLIRPAVLMAHGFASSASTFAPLSTGLVASGNYAANSLYALDYSGTSLAAYATNKNVISRGIDSIRRRQLRSGYVANKVDVIGHSMGGILSRIYLQDPGYRFDIFRMITIDSPHSGTQLADFGMELAKSNPGTILSLIPLSGAIRDFQTSSAATQDLNGNKLNKVKVPTHVISASYGGEGHVQELVAKREFVGALLTYLVDGLTGALIYNQDNDIIVPLSSQVAGLDAKYQTHYDGQWHYSVHTTPDIATNIANLLATSAKSENTPFTVGGFAPPILTFDPQGLGVTIEPFVESAPVISCTKGQNVRINFHPTQSVSSSIFVVTQQIADGKDEIYYMDNYITGNTVYNFAVPADAPSTLKFHLLGRWDGSVRGNVVYYSTSYPVTVLTSTP